MINLNREIVEKAAKKMKKPKDIGDRVYGSLGFFGFCIAELNVFWKMVDLRGNWNQITGEASKNDFGGYSRTTGSVDPYFYPWIP